MLKVALKNLLGHKFRTVLTAIAIALGVGFMAGTFVLTDTITKSFDELFSEAGAGIDAVVQGKAPFETGGLEGPEQRPDIDPSLTEAVRGVDGVADARPTVAGIAFVLGDDDKPLTQGAAPSFGANWTGIPGIDVFTITSGEPPTAPTDAVIDEATADSADIAVGDPIRVQTLSGTVDLTVSGIARFGETGNLGGAAFVLMDTPAAIDTFTTSGRIQGIAVIADQGVTQDEIVSRIEPVLPDGVEVISGDASTQQSQDTVEQGIGFFRTFLTAIGVVSLAAGAFLIYNTFGIIIGQRTRELALLRAMGASRRQVLTSVLAESTVTGLLASLLGLVGGIALATVMISVVAAIGIELPSTAPVLAVRTVVLSLLVGTVITVFSSILPAVRGSRVAPVAALRDTAFEAPTRSLARLVIGGVVAAIGVAGLLSGMNGGEVSKAAAGIVGLFAGVVILGPFIVPGIVAVVGAPLRLAGIAGTLGRDNARRNPKRSAGTASALMLAVTIITFIAVTTLSFTASFNAATDRYLKADLEISSGVQPTLGPALVDSLAAQPEVAAVTGVQRGQIQINDAVRPVYGVTPGSVEQVFDLQGVEGDLAGMGPDEIALDRATAEIAVWGIGKELSVVMPDGTATTLTVAAIYEDGGIVAQNSDGHYMVSNEVFEQYFGADFQTLLRIDVKGAEGVDLEQLRTVVEDQANEFPAATVRDREQIKDDSNQQLLVALGFLFVLLGLALVIGALGVTITLALSVFERTREIGLLRAVGATRAQMAGSICAESVILTLLGTLLGLAIGIVGAISVVQSQASSIDTLTVSIPVLFIVGVVVIAVGIGVVASLVPGWRAARMNVLDAVTVE
ncbi:MAG: ABC transporter permease [Iamia sp.]